MPLGILQSTATFGYTKVSLRYLITLDFVTERGRKPEKLSFVFEYIEDSQETTKTRIASL